MAKFFGEFSELEACVAGLGYTGQWSEDNGKKVFRSKDGAVLNWWSSTGTLHFQGNKAGRTKLAEAIEDVLVASPSTDDDSPLKLSAASSDTSPAGDSAMSPLADEDSKKVFVVYGHDESACDQLELVLRRLDLNPFVLGNVGGGGLTIIEALEKEIMSPSTEVRFGIVLLTPDDMGYEQGDDPENAEPRARQNVVMEMGMLIAALGRPRVAILKKGHVAVPSDASGIIYLPFNNHVKEAAPKLCQRLRGAGFELNPDSIAKVSS